MVLGGGTPLDGIPQLLGLHKSGNCLGTRYPHLPVTQAANSRCARVMRGSSSK